MNDVSWIKITTDIFDNEKIKLLETMPDGDTLVVIWFKLITLAGKKNAGGMVYITSEIPYTKESLAVVFNRPLNTVKLALKCFEEFKMIEIVNDFYQLVNWDKYQNVDGLMKIREQGRIRAEKHREKMKLLTNSNVTGNTKVTLRNATDKEEELDKDKEEETTDKPSAVSKTKTGNVFTPIFDTYITMYESIYGIKPTIVYSRITEQLKKITKDVSIEQIVSAIDYSRDDDFAKKAKHELGVILSAGVIGRLVNASSQNSPPLPRQDSATVAKKCPTCGSLLDQFNTCPNCHIEYDVTGRAI